MIEMKQLRIVFFGTPEFAVESLEALIGAGFDIAAVVTMPDKIGGRGHRVIESAVKLAAIAHGLPVLQPEKLSAPEFVDRLKEIAADLFIVIAFRMLPRVVWTMPPMGTFNLHASLLPRYRGAAPINRAIMNGETRTGVTTFLLKHEIDTGDILAQESTAIGPDENVGSLYGRLMKIGAGLTVSTVRAIAEGTTKPVPQDNVTVDGNYRRLLRFSTAIAESTGRHRLRIFTTLCAVFPRCLAHGARYHPKDRRLPPTTH